MSSKNISPDSLNTFCGCGEANSVMPLAWLASMHIPALGTTYLLSRIPASTALLELKKGVCKFHQEGSSKFCSGYQGCILIFREKKRQATQNKYCCVTCVKDDDNVPLFHFSQNESKPTTNCWTITFWSCIDWKAMLAYWQKLWAQKRNWLCHTVY